MKSDIVIRDCVHDQIFIDPIAKSFLNKNEFERLSYITQLGLAFKIYPSATHNRLSHSIGTYHLSRVLLESIEKEIHVDKIIKNSIMIAALCHDLGHGPFSHSWELYLKEDPRFKKYSHEEMSCKIIRRMAEKYEEIGSFIKMKEIDLDLICDLIKGSPGKDSPYNTNELKYIFEIISNDLNGIDVDKLDYLKRDSFFCGHSGTVFSLDRFLILYKPRFIQLPGENETAMHMCLKDTEFTIANTIFSTRNSFHRSIYKHKTTCSLTNMLIETLKKNEKNLKFREICYNAFFNEDPEYLEKFYSLTDPYIYLKMNIEYPDESVLLKRITNRDIYTHLLTKHIVFNDDSLNDNMPENIVLEKGTFINAKDIEREFNKLEAKIKPDDGDFVFDLQTFKSNSTSKDPILCYYQKDNEKATKYKQLKLIKSHALYLFWTGSRKDDSTEMVKKYTDQFNETLNVIFKDLYKASIN